MRAPNREKRGSRDTATCRRRTQSGTTRRRRRNRPKASSAPRRQSADRVAPSPLADSHSSASAGSRRPQQRRADRRAAANVAAATRPQPRVRIAAARTARCSQTAPRADRQAAAPIAGRLTPAVIGDPGSNARRLYARSRRTEGHEHPAAESGRKGSRCHGRRRTAQAGTDFQDPADAGGKERPDLL